MCEKRFAVIGGDKRNAYIALFLQQENIEVEYYGEWEEIVQSKVTIAQCLEKAIIKADCIIAGTPFKETKILEYLTIGQTLFAGLIPSDMMQILQAKKIIAYDFMKENEIAMKNAVATAEGIIAEAIIRKNTNIHNSKSIVLGYGKCAKVLCDKLKGFGAKVTVCCRKETALAEASAMGYQTISFQKLDSSINEFEYIYNTVPELVLGKDRIEKTREDVLILDIASKAGGVDYTYANLMHREAVQVLGIPGKYACKTSAEILKDYIIGKIE